jgi:predicted phage terminase large subunit-like protein
MNRQHKERAAIESVLELFGPLRLRNCPLTPTPRQEAFLLLRAREVFFGGAAAGGKSVALLMAALQYSDVPGYRALVLRPSLAELQLAGGLIELAHEWLASSRASWNAETKTWRFPGPGRTGSDGATLTFGYLADVNDLARYAGSGYSFLGFDELSRFREQLYRRMFRVLRQATARRTAARDGTRLADVPVRIRSASNPGGPGHTWVKERFVDPTTRHPNVIFLPSRLTDNPHLNTDEYTSLLHELPVAERARLLSGDWDIPDDGELFQRDWFEVIEPAQLPKTTHAVRYWDLAGTEPSSNNRDPDYTVGLRLDLHHPTGSFYITDVVRERKAPGAIEQLVAATAERDGRDVLIRIEQEPGAAGKALADRYRRHILRGYSAASRRVTGPKHVRAHPVAAAAENGLIKIVRGRHTSDFLDELTAFPHAAHDDCVDALSGAHSELATTSARGQARIFGPHGRIPIYSHERWAPTSAREPTADIATLLGARVWPTPPRRERQR